MPLIRTDDAPRKLRAVWLGPKGSTLPFEWTYVQWAVTIALIPVGVGLVLSLCLLLGLSPFTRAVFTLLWGPAVGIYLSVRLMKGVHYDEPLRFRRLVARKELSPWGRTAVPTEETWELRMPRIRDLQMPTFSTPPQDQGQPETQPEAQEPEGSTAADTAGITPADATGPDEPSATDTAGITTPASTPKEH